MDAEYLKKNVSEALTEALTSMAIEIPEDNIEYLGKYLLSYVERKKMKKIETDELGLIESKLSEYLVVQKEKNKQLNEIESEKRLFETRYQRFLSSIPFDYPTKEDAMDSICSFMESSLNIPAAYIAIKKVNGETETLNYIATGPSQIHIKGKKLLKVVIEERDESAPTRQGISFDAFKLPEVPEAEEEANEDDGAAPVIAKLPPKAQPLIIENVMREKRLKFFGIPKLGSYVALPFSYQSIEHEEGILLGAPPEVVEAPLTVEEGEEPIIPPTTTELAQEQWMMNKKEAHFIIGFDTIGNLFRNRSFHPEEIQRILQIGDELVKLMELQEINIGTKHIEYLNSSQYKLVISAVSAETFSAKIAEQEAVALAKIGEELAAEAAALAAKADPDGEPVATSELEKPYKESVAVLVKVWNPAITTGSVADGIYALTGYLIPPPSCVINLLYAISCLLNVTPTSIQNVCGDPDWKAIQKYSLTKLPELIKNYDPNVQYTVKPSKQNQLLSIKAFSESTTILDAGIYPPTMTICSNALLPWFQKAIAAREASIAFYSENKIILE